MPVDEDSYPLEDSNSTLSLSSSSSSSFLSFLSLLPSAVPSSPSSQISTVFLHPLSLIVWVHLCCCLLHGPPCLPRHRG